MAVFLNNKVGVKINSVDLSDHVTALTLNRSFDELEVTAMGDSSHKFVKGLEASTVTIDFLNDTASASVLATLQAAWGTTVTCVFLQDKGSVVSATNPLYTVSLLINNTTDLNGDVASIGTQSITFTANSTIAVASTGTF
jgi:CTP:molybdopterin cytidylyltransferase MocA